MQDTTPIFKDVSQALHVCFLIHSLPAGTVSPTAIVIDRLRKEFDLDDCSSKPSSGINFSGLTPQEIRGQAAQVVSMVNNLPNKMESAAVRSFYGRDEIQVKAALEFAQHVQPHVAEDMELVRTMVLYTLPERDREEAGTMAEIADRYGLSVRTVRYYIDKTKKVLYAYRKRGIAELESRFINGELVAEAG